MSASASSVLEAMLCENEEDECSEDSCLTRRNDECSPRPLGQVGPWINFNRTTGSLTLVRYHRGDFAAAAEAKKMSVIRLWKIVKAVSQETQLRYHRRLSPAITTPSPLQLHARSRKCLLLRRRFAVRERRKLMLLLLVEV
jgi:hypothetical protein